MDFDEIKWNSGWETLTQPNLWTKCSFLKNHSISITKKNLKYLTKLQKLKKIETLFNSNVKEIFEDKVSFIFGDRSDEMTIKNDLTYIFAGGILPTSFLESIGIKITKKFGDAILKH